MLNITSNLDILRAIGRDSCETTNSELTARKASDSMFYRWAVSVKCPEQFPHNDFIRVPLATVVEELNTVGGCLNRPVN